MFRRIQIFVTLSLASAFALADARPVAGGRAPAVLPMTATVGEHKGGFNGNPGDLRPLETGASAPEPQWHPSTCGLRFPAIPEGVGGVKKNSAGYYVDYQTGICRFGRRSEGENPFPFATQDDCAQAASSGFCVSRNPASVGLIPSNSSYVQGTVEVWTGNFIPGSSPQVSGKVAPGVTRVFFLSGKAKPSIGKTEMPIPGTGEAKVAAVVPTDLNGNFSVALPPGKYTVLTERKGKLYLDGFDGDGTFISHDLGSKAVLQLKLQDTSEAVY